MNKNFTVIKHYIQAIQSLSFASSKNHNKGDICYPYAYGYSASQFHSVLERLELNKKQVKQLEKIINELNDTRIVEENIDKSI